MKKISMENKLRLSILFNIILCILFLLLGSISISLYSKLIKEENSHNQHIYFYTTKISDLIKEVNDKDQYYNDYYANYYIEDLSSKDESIASLEAKINTVVNDYKTLVDETDKLVQDNLYLYNTNEGLNATIKDLLDRVSKYEQYDYAMFDSAGKRNDITYENIKLFEELLEGKICDNLNLYLSWIMIESEGHNQDRNPHSTATGLPQFLKGTGKFVWTDLLGREEEYDHYVTVEIPENSIPMMVAYVDYLCKNNKGNLDKVIDCYRGLHDTPYLNKFNKYLSYSGNSINSIGKEVQNNYNKYISSDNT